MIDSRNRRKPAREPVEWLMAASTLQYRSNYSANYTIPCATLQFLSVNCLVLSRETHELKLRKRGKCTTCNKASAQIYRLDVEEAREMHDLR